MHAFEHAPRASGRGPLDQHERLPAVRPGQRRDEPAAHRELIEKALGGDAEPAPELDFGDVFASPESFIDAAVALEETAVAAYNGQATNLTPEALATAARIASVEARHASWARGIAGEAPAPRGSDRAIGAARAETELAELAQVTE